MQDVTKSILPFLFFRSIMLSEKFRNSKVKGEITMRIELDLRQRNDQTRKKTTGEQIQSIASLFFFVGCCIFVLACFTLIAADQYFVAILVTGIGILSTWISTRFIQGFGELLEDAADTCEYTHRIALLLESKYASENDTPPAADTDEDDSDNALIML